jgi:N-acetylneuraminic acid mutarotase
MKTVFFACFFVMLVVFFSPLRASGMDAASIPPLPVAHANNAIAAVTLHNQLHIFSFAGLRAGKTWQDTSKEAYMYVEGRGGWERLPDLPVAEGRLAATAEAVGERIYYFGGYTVAQDGSEVSAPENFEYNPYERTYKRINDMAVPVDDAVSFVYADRYIYIVSGWHDTGNVRNVQVYDTIGGSWFSATDYPGSPVFGHAGGIVGNQFVIADGVAIFPGAGEAPRTFETVNEGWMGTINPENPAEITYRRLPQLPGRGHYRMGGAGDVAGNRVLFAGGTPNAYNYDGIGYNGEPSSPKKHIFAWDFGKDDWVAYRDKSIASMDHRGLIKVDNQWVTVGGIIDGQHVTAKILRAIK